METHLNEYGIVPLHGSGTTNTKNWLLGFEKSMIYGNLRKATGWTWYHYSILSFARVAKDWWNILLHWNHAVAQQEISASDLLPLYLRAKEGVFNCGKGSRRP